jgi:hypothetical protein
LAGSPPPATRCAVSSSSKLGVKHVDNSHAADYYFLIGGVWFTVAHKARMAKKKRTLKPRTKSKIHMEDGIGLSDECIRDLIIHLLAPLLTANFAVEHKSQSQPEHLDKIAA